MNEGIKKAQTTSKVRNVRYMRDGRSPIPSSESISRVMRANKGKNTSPEIELRKALRKAGYGSYRLHLKKVPGSPDISYPKQKVAIFVNGCFWHRCPICNPKPPKTHAEYWGPKFQRNVDRDMEKSGLLERQGWKVVVAWECEIKSDVNGIVNRIIGVLEEHDGAR